MALHWSTHYQIWLEDEIYFNFLLHWDLVRILADGEIRFDDVLIQKNGRFVHRDLLSLNPEK